ncbi:MAG: hypothetical protein IJR46_02855 [Neisseriaceae bacterium]|nr:hypothetical protein [Neisseriaceae bacterium]
MDSVFFSGSLKIKKTVQSRGLTAITCREKSVSHLAEQLQASFLVRTTHFMEFKIKQNKTRFPIHTGKLKGCCRLSLFGESNLFL